MVTSQLTMSPSCSTRSSGIPWQMTSFTEVHSDFGIALVVERARIATPAMYASWQIWSSVSVVTPAATAAPTSSSTSRAARPAARMRSGISSGGTAGTSAGASGAYGGRGISAGTERRAGQAAGAHGRPVRPPSGPRSPPRVGAPTRRVAAPASRVRCRLLTRIFVPRLQRRSVLWLSTPRSPEPPVRQSWLSPLAATGAAGTKGIGIFAVAAIPAGTTVAGFGGHVVDRAELHALDEDVRIHALQIDDDLFLASSRRSTTPTTSTTRASRTAGSSDPSCSSRCARSQPARSSASTTR